MNATLYAAISAQVALSLLGEPNAGMSRGVDLRFGRRGSISIDTSTGRWFDHQAGAGGGVLDLVMRETGRDRAGAVGWLREGGYLDHAPRAPQCAPTPPDPRPSTLTAAVRLWNSARALAGSPGERYLDSRGIGWIADSPALRYHGFARHPSGVLAPAVVAPVVLADGAFSGVHRTYLQVDGSGKANLSPDKAMLGRCSGGAVRLVEAIDGGLLVGEGIESTAAAARLLGWAGSAWAALSTSGMLALRIPGRVRAVTIAGDRDGPGLKAAAALARRIEAAGRTVAIVVPDKGGADFADELAAWQPS